MFELLVVADDGHVVLRQEYATWSAAASDAWYYEMKEGYTDITITRR